MMRMVSSPGPPRTVCATSRSATALTSPPHASFRAQRCCAPTLKRQLVLRFGLRGWWLRLLRRTRAAGGRDDVVHAQVFDHLAVVIHGMKGADIGDGEARGEERERRLGQRRDSGLGGDGADGFMAERERRLQILDNFGFGLQLGGAVGFLL